MITLQITSRFKVSGKVSYTFDLVIIFMLDIPL
jgi:hypothetical protein